jgi:hypothetical protein
MEFVSQTDAGTRVRIAVDIKNVGKTPARSVQIRWNQSLLPHPMTKERKFEWNSDDVVAEGVVYPEGEHSSVKSFTIKPGDIDRLRARDGTVALYVYGVVTYLDAFKRRQKSEFCAFITGDKWDVWRAAARAAEDRRALAGFTFAPFNNT